MTQAPQRVPDTIRVYLPNEPAAGFVVMVDPEAIKRMAPKDREQLELVTGADMTCDQTADRAAAAKAIIDRMRQDVVRTEGWRPDLVMLRYVGPVEDDDTFPELVPKPKHLPRLHHVDVPCLVELKDGVPDVWMMDRWLPVVSQRSGTQDDLAQRVKKRNRLHERNSRMRGGYSLAPSGLADTFSAAWPATVSTDTRHQALAEAIKEGRAELEISETRDDWSNEPTGSGTVRVRVSLDEVTRMRIGTISKRKSKRSGARLQSVLPYDQKTGSIEEVRDMAMSRLAFLDTRTLKVLMACMVMADLRGGRFPAAPSEVVKIWGLVPKKTSQRVRKAVSEDLEMLREVELEIEVLGGNKAAGSLSFPLFRRYGTVRIPGKGPVDVLDIHPALWEPVARGKGLLFDHRILAADDQRQEWELRMYLRIAGGWSLGWVRDNRLRESGGQQTLKLTELLAGSGIDVRPMLERGGRGLPYLLDRVERALRTLGSWAGGPLLVGTLDRGRTIDECRVHVRPPDGIAKSLTERRSGTLAKLEQLNKSDGCADEVVRLRRRSRTAAQTAKTLKH